MSPRSIAALPSRDELAARAAGRAASLISDAASSKYHSHASGVRLNAARRQPLREPHLALELGRVLVLARLVHRGEHLLRAACARRRCRACRPSTTRRSRRGAPRRRARATCARGRPRPSCASTSSSARRARCAASASPPCAASMSRSASRQPRLEAIELLDHLAEAVAERVGAQVHQLAAQVAHRAVERLGRRVGHEQVRDLLEHLADRRHERARREPAAAIELDRDLDRRAGRHACP